MLKFLGFMWNPLSWVMEFAALMAIGLANGGVFFRLAYYWHLVFTFVFSLCTSFIIEIYILLDYCHAGQTSRLARFHWYRCAVDHQLHNQFH